MQNSASNPSQVKKASEKQKKGYNKDKANAQFVMKSYEGRELMRWVLDLCGFEYQSYVEGSFDQTAFREGKKAVGNEIFRLLNDADAPLVARMQQEHKARLNGEKPETQEVDEDKAVVE